MRYSKGWGAVLIIILLLLLDQVLKIWIKTHMQLHESIEITPWFYLYFTENPGMGIRYRGGLGNYSFPYSVSWLYCLSDIICISWLKKIINSVLIACIFSIKKRVLFSRLPPYSSVRLFHRGVRNWSAR